MNTIDSVTLVQATPDDVEQVRDISIQTFRETFTASNTEADMEAYIRSSRSQEVVIAELKNPGSETWLAKTGDGEIVGYLKINQGTAQTEPQPDDFIEIERIYVLNSHQGRKIGVQLMDFALEKAAGLGKKTVWLGVWEFNLKAIAFYNKMGFVPFGKHSFLLGSDEQTDIMMKNDLVLPGRK